MCFVAGEFTINKGTSPCQGNSSLSYALSPFTYSPSIFKKIGFVGGGGRVEGEVSEEPSYIQVYCLVGRILLSWNFEASQPGALTLGDFPPQQ